MVPEETSGQVYFYVPLMKQRLTHPASVAQWQSTALVKRWFAVQVRAVARCQALAECGLSRCVVWWKARDVRASVLVWGRSGQCFIARWGNGNPLGFGPG
jgi:hypothetical protein